MKNLEDEFHDSAKCDIELIRLLGGKRKNVCFILDNDQSIYGFRGADLDEVLAVRAMYSDLSIYNLDQNYRCSNTIVEASRSLIDNNPKDIEKNIFTSNEVGDKILYFEENTALEESLRVAKTIELFVSKYNYKYSDIAILYRLNNQSRKMEEVLLKRQIPCEVLSGINFYSRKEIKDLIAFLRFIINPDDLLSFERIANIAPEKRGIGPAAIQKIVDHARSFHPPISILEACDSVDNLRNPAKKSVKDFYVEMLDLISSVDNMTVKEFCEYIITKTKYLDFLENFDCKDDEELFQEKMMNVCQLVQLSEGFGTIDEFLEQSSLDRITDDDDDTNKVQLLTMHMSKGLEYPVVFLIGCNEGTSPHFNSLKSRKLVEEERRLFYVGMTRAKKNLVLTRPLNIQQGYGPIVKSTMSRFIREIDDKYIYQAKINKK